MVGIPVAAPVDDGAVVMGDEPLLEVTVVEGDFDVVDDTVIVDGLDDDMLPVVVGLDTVDPGTHCS